MLYRILFVLFVAATVSCNKAIDINPENSVTFKNGLETPKDIEAILAGAGQFMLYVSYNAWLQESKGEFADDYNLNVAPYRQLAPDVLLPIGWSFHYNVIAQSNIVLNFSDNIQMPDARRNIYKGQAYFFKAIVYFDLIRKWGDCPIVKQDVDFKPIAKSKWTEVADYAIEMAQHAIDLLPEFEQVTDYTGKPPRYKSTPCKGSAYALLAHLCAWKAGAKYFAGDQGYDEQELWRRAEEACSAIINSGVYQLAANAEEVCSKVFTGGSQESIYETVYKDLMTERTGGGQVSDGQFNMAAVYETWPVMPNSSPYDIVNTNLRIYNNTVNVLYPGNDERKYAYFYKFQEMSSPDSIGITGGFAYPFKWRDIVVETEGWNAGNFINFNVNKIWWRLADIILLRAECRARLGNDPGAIADINTIRARANADLYHPDEYEGDIRYAVFKERERELLMEGYRYYDIIRNGYVKTHLGGGFRTASLQDFKDGAFFFMLDGNALQNNPLMRQNKYWQKFQ